MTKIAVAEATAVESRFVRDGAELVRELRLGGTVHRSRTRIDESTGDDLGDWWKAHLRGQGVVPDHVHGTVTAVDLFCGPGGLTVGFDRACRELGYTHQTLAAADHDPEAVGVYERNHHPFVASAESVSVLVDYRVKGRGDSARFRFPPELLDGRWADLRGGVDVVLAGPPCQGHSNLNNKTRREDPRNELYLSVAAIAIGLQARAVVIENVPAVVHDRLGVVAATTRLLSDNGYTVDTAVVKADRLGWAQRRARFVLVATRGCAPLPLADISAGLAGEARDVTWAIGDLDRDCRRTVLDRRVQLSEENLRRIDYLFDNDIYDLPFEERPECHQNGTTYTSVYGRLYPDRPAPTITTGFMTPGRGRYIHPTERRVISPAEAARLQGFPDTYVFEDGSGISPSSLKLAKWIGDAVPMPIGFTAGLSVLSAPKDQAS